MKHHLKHLRSRIDGMSIAELNAAIDQVDTWKRQAIANLQAKEARERKRARAVDTRRKVVLGSFVLFRLDASRDASEIGSVRAWLRCTLPPFLTRTVDQVLLSDLIADGPTAVPVPVGARAAKARDARRKILLGALVLHHLEAVVDVDHGWLTRWLSAELPTFVTRKLDAAVVADILTPPSPAKTVPDVIQAH